jgi:hypothetical protein
MGGGIFCISRDTDAEHRRLDATRLLQDICRPAIAAATMAL